MILVRFAPNGLKQTVDLRGLFWGQTAVLLGGAPSLLTQPYGLLEQRGVLVMAMNNAARTVRPALFVGSDNPNCFDPMILADPGIMKFGNLAWADARCDVNGGGRLYKTYPNTVFWMTKKSPPWDEFFADTAEIPWYQNTLFVGLHILYHLGVRRIILAGSDFEVGRGADYSSGQLLSRKEKDWNAKLYAHLVRELVLMKPVFEKHGLELLDSSANTKLAGTYRHVSLEEAVAMCRGDFPRLPAEPDTLLHCSAFFGRQRKVGDIIADRPGQPRDPAAGIPPLPQGDTPQEGLQTIL